MSKNLRDYTKTLYALDGVVRRMRDGDWSKQSPNEDWTAKQTLGHVIWGIKRLTAAARGEDPPGEQLEDDIAGDLPALTWAAAMDNLLEALDRHGVLDKEIDSPLGTMTVDEALGRFFIDPLTHTWDIAKAAGVDAAIPDELAERAMRILDAAGDAIRGPGRYKQVVDIDPNESPVNKFVAITGRDPR